MPLLAGTLLMMSTAAPLASQDCEAPEVVQDNPEYNALACRAVRAYATREYQVAADLLRRALDVPLFELPNYRPLPRLALAYLELGRMQEARIALEEARLALSVLLGFIDCRLEGDRFFLQDGTGVVSSSSVTSKTIRRMCGEAYQYVYEQADLNTLAADSELLHLYFDARSRLPD